MNYGNFYPEQIEEDELINKSFFLLPRSIILLICLSVYLVILVGKLCEVFCVWQWYFNFNTSYEVCCYIIQMGLQSIQPYFVIFISLIMDLKQSLFFLVRFLIYMETLCLCFSFILIKCFLMFYYVQSTYVLLLIWVFNF
jgi:hypothetical protein